jgi:hypothetical protein
MQAYSFRTRSPGGIERTKIIELPDENHALRAALKLWRRFVPSAFDVPATGEIHRLEVRNDHGTPICILQYKTPSEDL